MKNLLVALFILFALPGYSYENLSDAEDANLIPASEEKRLNEKVNLPDQSDPDFIPSSQEPRQQQEVRGDASTPVERDYNIDNDKYSDDDNFGNPSQIDP